jgi:hypothetical protein
MWLLVVARLEGLLQMGIPVVAEEAVYSQER